MLGQRNAKWGLFQGFLLSFFIVLATSPRAADEYLFADNTGSLSAKLQTGSAVPANGIGSLTSYQGVDSILCSLPESKQREFIGRKWTSQDAALRVVQEEGVRAASILTLMVTGRLAINGLISFLAGSETSGSFLGWLGADRIVAPTVTLGVQTAMDYVTSTSLEDFYLRSGSNLANVLIPGDSNSFWRQGLSFSLGHLVLANHYWPEIRMQLRNQHEGIRRIRFMSPVLDELIDLELMAPGRTSGESAQLVMHFDTAAIPPIAAGDVNDLGTHWLDLANVCQQHGVTSVRIRPNGTNSKGMFVQLWRDDRMLSETILTVSSDSGVGKLWLTDWLVRKNWPEGRRLGFESVVNPLTEPVILAIKSLVKDGDESSAVVMRHLPSVISPGGRLAMFSTGANGYLFVDRNKTVDIELPELWLNTEHTFEDEMKVALARLEEQQEPGHWRGVHGLGIDLAKNYVTRTLLYAGLNWFQKYKSESSDSYGLPDAPYEQVKLAKQKKGSALWKGGSRGDAVRTGKRVSFSSTVPRDSSGEVMLPSSVWAETGEYKDVQILDPDGWDRTNFDEDFNRPVTEKTFREKLSESTVRWPKRPGQIH